MFDGLGVGLDRLALRGGGEHHGELIAPEPGDERVIVDHLGDPFGDLAQEDVALVVTEGVVDFLEAVEVDEHHDDRLVGLAIDQGLAQLVIEASPVREAGQGVVQRLVVALVGLPAQSLEQAVVAQADAPVRRQGLEELEILLAESIDLAPTTAHQQRAQRFVAGAQRGHHGVTGEREVLAIEQLVVPFQRRLGEGAVEHGQRSVVQCDERRNVVVDEDELGSIGAEQITRVLEQRKVERSLGERGRDRAAEGVQLLEVLGAPSHV